MVELRGNPEPNHFNSLDRPHPEKLPSENLGFSGRVATETVAQDGGEDQREPVTLATLAAHPRWVAWQTEGRGKAGKPTKVPYTPATGRRALADADSDEVGRVFRSDVGH